MMEDQKSEKFMKAAALRYDRKLDKAPRVIASGRGWLADRIIKEAKKVGIPIVEDPALVAVLLGVGLGEEIPEEAYLAVAQILVFLSRVDASKGDNIERHKEEDQKGFR
ncbi:MAG: EscU/YscU/HrcU family type III secretion system export apparatus switch protein [Synergistota bacterium]|nr:EscU/YscU/HrcU family type III secretion system export apparatus switch protein [Synergistota bacterium]